MSPFDALSELPSLIADYKAVAAELIETKRALNAAAADEYLTIEGVAAFWKVTDDTARDMIKAFSVDKKGNAIDIKVISYGAKTVRYRRSDIVRISEMRLVSMKNMLAQKAESRMARKDKTGQ